MRSVYTVWAVVVLLGAGWAGAQEAPTTEEVKEGFSVDLSLTIPSSYVFRGYVIQDNRFIVQPEAFVTYTTTVGGFQVAPYVGAWANFTDVTAPGDPNCFDELDLYAGVDIELGSDFTLGMIYTYYMSPGNVFDDIHEVGITLTHADVVNPTVGIYRELCNKNGDENTYIELGINPGFDVPQMEKLRLDFPCTMGLSPDKYYTHSDGDGAWVGYFQVGVHATYSFTDSLSCMVGVEYWNLHADSTQASNDGDEHQFVALVGVKFSQ